MKIREMRGREARGKKKKLIQCGFGGTSFLEFFITCKIVGLRRVRIHLSMLTYNHPSGAAEMRPVATTDMYAMAR